MQHFKYSFLVYKKRIRAVSRRQHGKHREPSAKTLRSPHSAELNAGLLPWCQNVEMKILINISSFPRIWIEPTKVALSCVTVTTVARFCPGEKDS